VFEASALLARVRQSATRVRQPAFRGTFAGHFGSYARSVSTLLSS
jgi:hypothetical protein